jgi:hypothetical protein
VRDRLPCDGYRVDGPVATFGIAHTPGDPAPTITTRALFEYNRSDAQPILTASGNVPGLTLVARHGDAAPMSSAYRSRVGDDLDPEWSALCVEVG